MKSGIIIRKEQVGSVKFMLNPRADGRIEAICEHGVGHTVYSPRGASKNETMHGCDGCCSTDDFKKYAADIRSKRRLQ